MQQIPLEISIVCFLQAMIRTLWVYGISRMVRVQVSAILSGRGHTGTINNGSWNQNGKFGPAVVFNGSNTSVNLGDNSDFTVSSFTLEGWFKFYNPGIQDLMRRDNSNQNGDAYNLGTRDGKIEYGINGRSPLRSHTQFQANIWYHIAATYDGTTMAIYINGVLDNSQTDTGGTPSSVGPLMLGVIIVLTLIGLKAKCKAFAFQM